MQRKSANIGGFDPDIVDEGLCSLEALKPISAAITNDNKECNEQWRGCQHIRDTASGSIMFMLPQASSKGEEGGKCRRRTRCKEQQSTTSDSHFEFDALLYHSIGYLPTRESGLAVTAGL